MTQRQAFNADQGSIRCPFTLHDRAVNHPDLVHGQHQVEVFSVLIHGDFLDFILILDSLSYDVKRIETCCKKSPL